MARTNIADTIEINSYTAKYDESVKEMLADKQILARILKYSLEEFANEELSVIIKSMDEPVVSQMRMEPGHANLNKIQKSTNPSKLGYHIDNRAIYYLGRMISSQKEVEFQNSHYDELKAVRSIWICMDSADDEDSINRIRFTQENVFGKKMKLENLDKVQGVVVRLRENENAEISKNVLIAMLEELLKRDSAEAKKKKLKEQYDIIMDVETERRVNTMCNLSEVVLERGMEQGMVQVAEKMLKANKPAEEIKNFTGVSIDKLKELADKLGVTLD